MTLDYAAFGSSSWKIELIDLSGKTLLTSSRELPAGRITWSLSSVRRGVYFVRMTDSYGRTLTRNFIKQ